MQRLLLVIVLIVLQVAVVGQTQEPDAESIVRQALSQASRGTYTSTAQKELGRLGDASAVALTRIVGEKALDKSDIEPILLILTLSYAEPRVVKVDSDRQPRATLLLLRYLDLATSDVKLREKIASTQAYVRDKYASSLKQRDASAPQRR